MRKVFAECAMYSLEGFISRHADLDGVVMFIDADNGKTRQLNGWLWSFSDCGEA